MPFTIRSTHRSDYEPVISLCSRVDPDRVEHVRPVWQRAEEQSGDGVPIFRRWVAVDDATQRLAGYAMLWSERRWKFRMSLMVDHHHRQQGIGGELFAALLAEIKTTPAVTLQARTWGDWPESLRFLERRGFAEIHRMYELRLAIQQTDWSSFAALPGRLSAQGIEIATLQREAVEDAECWAKLTDLQNAAMVDWPDPDPNDVVIGYSVDEFRKMVDSWQMLPNAFFIAKADGRYIGYSGLGRDWQVPEAIGSGPTAVRPGYRNQGVATALKLLSLASAKQLGYALASSRSANPAMIRVNEKLGFVRGRAEVRFVKRMELSLARATP